MHRLDTPRGTYEISTDPERMDVVAIHAALDRTYWAAGRPLETVRRSIAGSLNFGLFDPSGAQVGFSRVITDRATFAWLCDVYVLEEHRGLQLGKALMAAVTSHPDLQDLRRMMLATADAHGLYAQFGFEPLEQPGHFMARIHDAHRQLADT
jgi:GNAT superfamily N-acetyltransferase